MKSILITGSTGFLGARAVLHFQKDYKVLAPTRNDLDITDENSVIKYFELTRPQFVLHSAAISDIQTAQDNPSLSDTINRLSPLFIAKACKNVGAKLINLSSDQVYTGNKERFALSENVPLAPQNLYAKQKLAAEQLVCEALPESVSLRLTWMYDSPSSLVTPNKGLMTTLLSASQSGLPFKVNSNQLRSITFIKNVIENLPACFSLPGGVYNYGSENDMSAYELFRYAAEIMKLPLGTVEEYFGDAQNILINTDRLKSHGIILPTAKEGLEQAVFQ